MCLFPPLRLGNASSSVHIIYLILLILQYFLPFKRCLGAIWHDMGIFAGGMFIGFPGFLVMVANCGKQYEKIINFSRRRYWHFQNFFFLNYFFKGKIHLGSLKEAHVSHNSFKLIKPTNNPLRILGKMKLSSSR